VTGTTDLSAGARELLKRRLGGTTAAAFPSGPRPARPPLSFGQRRLWFLHRLTTAKTAYNTPASFRLRGRLDTVALLAAMNLVIVRHEALRTRFGVADGEPFQIVDDPAPLTLPITAAPTEAAAAELVRADAGTEFDLADGPLFRARLVRLTADDHVLSVVVHHTVFDRASLEIWLGEVATGYAALSAGHQPDLAALPAQYADFATWQRNELTDDVLNGHLAFWRDQLAGVPFVLDLPTDRPRPALPSGRAGYVDLQVPADTVSGLRALAKSRGTTLFVVALAAYQAVLGRHAGADELVVGCPATGRTRVALEPLIGFFVNSLPVRADLRGDPPVAVLVDRARDALLGAHEHQDVPFDRVVEELGPPRDLSRNPLFQVWFDLVSGDEQGVPGLPGLRVEPFDPGQVRTRFDMELHLLETNDGTVTGRLQYAQDLFDEDTATAFAVHYRTFLQEVGRDPALRLSGAEIFPAEELRRILRDWGTASGWRRTT
jgi:condensation domain-containing protein